MRIFAFATSCQNAQFAFQLVGPTINVILRSLQQHCIQQLFESISTRALYIAHKLALVLPIVYSTFCGSFSLSNDKLAYTSLEMIVCPYHSFMGL